MTARSYQPQGTHVRKLSVSLPVDLVDEVDALAARRGTTRSRELARLVGHGARLAALLET